jgi:hypothetical protein
MNSRALLVILALAMALYGGMKLGRRVAPAPAGPPQAAARPLTPAQRGAGLRFAPEVAAADRQLVLEAIAQARPQARRLIDAVDGAVTARVGDTGATAAGYTSSDGDGYLIVLDLARVYRMLGMRGVARLVLHELGHVVDYALVPDGLERTLDAGIPRGYQCAGVGDCAGASPDERFAETFAKWATGDIGVNLSIGYRVPPPPSLDAWGEPLARLVT